MLPIVTEQVKANKVSIYNQRQDAKHPMAGVELTNSTDLKLLAGPVTVLDGGMYAGDALIDHMTPGEKRLLSYAVDLSITVDPSSHNSSEITAVKIVRGVLHITRRTDYTQTYRIKNKSDEQRVVLIEHPYNNQRKLIQPAEAYEKTPQWYRFRVPVKADTTGEFVVKEQQTTEQVIAILHQSVGQFVAYIRNGEIDPDVRDALQKAADMKNTLSQLQQTLQQRQRELDQITGGQDRLRENIQTVGADSQLGKRYVQKLADQEDHIEQLQGQITDLRQKIEAQQKALEDYLQDLNVE